MAKTIRTAAIFGTVIGLLIVWLAGGLQAQAPPARFHLVSNDSIVNDLRVTVIKDTFTGTCYAAFIFRDQVEKPAAVGGISVSGNVHVQSVLCARITK